MKTAKEMFEELGYEETKPTLRATVLLVEFDKKDVQITFDISTKQYFIYGSEYIYWFDKKLHQAITQQMKELGWLDEER